MTSVMLDFLPKEEYDKFIGRDIKAYTEFFDKIRNAIIRGIDIDEYSSKSLIAGIESYHIKGEKGNPRRLRQVVEIYNYCLTHPNDVSTNDKNFILGVLLASNFEYASCNDDKFVVVNEFLNGINKYVVSYKCHTIMCILDIAETMNALEFGHDIAQPSFSHNLKCERIEALRYLPRVFLHFKHSKELIRCVSDGDFDKVKHLVEECGANVNVQDEMGYTPLLMAIMYDQYDIFDYLIEHGADCNFKSNGDRYPIITAVEFNRPDIVYELLIHCVDIKVRNGDGKTPLMIAAENESLDILEQLVEELRSLRHRGI